MPGAGSYKLANWMASLAPKDGTAFGIVLQTVALDEVLGAPGVQYKAAQFNWIGRVTSSGEVMITSRKSGVTSIKDAMQREVAVGTTGPGSPSQGYPVLLNAAAGTKFRIISGYPSSGDVLLALEKGEVDAASGLCSRLISTAHRDWIDRRKINIILSETVATFAYTAGCPRRELGKRRKNAQCRGSTHRPPPSGRPFTAPRPTWQAEPRAMLRAAFRLDTKRTRLPDQIEKTKAEFAPDEWRRIQKLVETPEVRRPPSSPG